MLVPGVAAVERLAARRPAGSAALPRAAAADPVADDPVGSGDSSSSAPSVASDARGAAHVAARAIGMRTSASPVAMALNSSARWAIDLSPGSRSSPRSRRPARVRPGCDAAPDRSPSIPVVGHATEPAGRHLLRLRPRPRPPPGAAAPSVPPG